MEKTVSEELIKKERSILHEIYSDIISISTEDEEASCCECGRMIHILEKDCQEEFIWHPSREF
jgi:hypothetical protein